MGDQKAVRGTTTFALMLSVQLFVSISQTSNVPFLTHLLSRVRREKGWLPGRGLSPSLRIPLGGPSVLPEPGVKASPLTRAGDGLQAIGSCFRRRGVSAVTHSEEERKPSPNHLSLARFSSDLHNMLLPLACLPRR